MRTLVNRLCMPTKHLLIVEDDIDRSIDILRHISIMYGPQGSVQVSVAADSISAIGIVDRQEVNLILLDHDLPWGCGTELLEYMRYNNITIPVITFSGVDDNNIRLMKCGANYMYSKYDVIGGKADSIIKLILDRKDN